MAEWLAPKRGGGGFDSSVSTFTRQKTLNHLLLHNNICKILSSVQKASVFLDSSETPSASGLKVWSSFKTFGKSVVEENVMVILLFA